MMPDRDDDNDRRRPRDDPDQARWIIDGLRRAFDDFNLRTVPELRQSLEEVRRGQEQLRATVGEHRAVQAERDEAAQERWRDVRARLDGMQTRLDLMVEQYNSLRHVAGLPQNRSIFAEWGAKEVTIAGGIITAVLIGLYEWLSARGAPIP